MSRKLIIITILFILTTVGGTYAADTSWTFDSASQYTYDTSVIEVTGGVAKLRDLGGTKKDDSVLEYNSAFVAGDTTRGYSGTAAGADVSLVLDTATSSTYVASGTFESRVFDTASGCGGWQRLNATVVNGDIPNADSLFDSGLVSVWHMNTNNSGDTTIADAKGTNTGTLYCSTGGYNTTTAQMWDANGKLGTTTYKCLEFDSTDDYVDCGSGASLSISNTITVEAWVYITTTRATEFICGKGNTGFYGYWMGIDGGPYRFSVGNGSSTLQLSSLTAPTLNKWQHVVGTFDGQTVRMYIDGVFKNQGSLDGPINYSGIGSFKIGNIEGLIGTRYWTGLIDEVSIWNRALDSSEIADHYNSGAGKELHRAAKFQVRSGNTVSELTGYGFAGSLGNSTSYYTGANETLVSGGGFNTTHRFAQYKAYLNASTDSTRTPTVASVALVGTAGSVFDNTDGDFALGAKSQVTSHKSQVTSDGSFVGLSKMPNGGYNYQGTYTSRVIDGGIGANWSTLNFAVGGTEIDASENGLVALWHMNGNWLDAKGTNNGTAGGGATFSTSAKLGTHCGSFDSATSSYVNCGSGASLNITQSISVEVWAKRNSIASNDNERIVMKATSGEVGAYGLTVRYGQYNFAVYVDNGWRFQDVGTWTDTDWHYVVGTYDFVAKVIRTYKDGVKIGEVTLSGLLTYAINTVAEPLNVGRWIYGPRYFNGLIDEVAIWNRALSASEVMNHYQNASPGTIKFQCRAGTTESEVSTSGFTGPDSTTATYYDSTGTDLGMQFDNKRYLQYRAYLEGR